MNLRLSLLVLGLSATTFAVSALGQESSQEEPPFATVLLIERIELEQPLAVFVDGKPDEARSLALIYLRLSDPTDFLPRAMLADEIFLGAAEGQMIGTMPGASIAAVVAPDILPLDQVEIWTQPGRSHAVQGSDERTQDRLEHRRNEAPSSVVPLAPAVEAGLLKEEIIKLLSPDELFAHAAQGTTTLEKRE